MEPLPLKCEILQTMQSIKKGKTSGPEEVPV